MGWWIRWRESASCGGFAERLPQAFLDLVDLDRVALALDLNRPQHFGRDPLLDQIVGILADKHRAACGGAFEPGGDIDVVADDV